MNSVALTHFINPYLIWCHRVHVPEIVCAKIYREEQKLESLYDSGNGSSKVSEVKVGAKVTVKYRGKCIRATVLDVINDEEHSGECILWAIDYGIPVHTKVENIRLLPEDTDLTVNHIICVGIANVLPAMRFYDTSNFSWITERKKEWSQYACETLEKVLLEATRIVLKDNFTVENQYWGDLEITNSTGRSILASEFLVKLEVAICSGPDSRETYLALSTTHTPLWTFNNPRLKDNTFSYSDQVSKSVVAHEMGPRKIPEWAMKYDNHKYDRVVGKVFDEIGWDDSVSMKQMRDTTLEAERNNPELGIVGMKRELLNLQKMQLQDPGDKALVTPFEAFEIGSPAKTKRMALPNQKKKIQQLALNRTDVLLNTLHDACTKKDETQTRQNTAVISKALGGAASPSTDKALGIVCRERADELEYQPLVVGQSPSVHSAQRLENSRTVPLEGVPNKMPQTMAYADFRKVGEGNEQQPMYHEADSSRMVPTGFDLATHEKESNHSDPKTTTRHDKIPHENATMDKFFKDYFDTSEEHGFRLGRANRDKNKHLADDASEEQAPKSHSSAAGPRNLNENNAKIRLHAEQDSKETLDSSIQLESLVSDLLPPKQKKSGISECANINQIEKFGLKSEKLPNELQSQDFWDIGKPTTKPFVNFVRELSLKDVDGESTLCTRFINLMLAHSKVSLQTQTLTKRTEAKFAPQIHDRMTFLGVSKLFPLQAYAWPHLLRGHSLLAVNPPRSGKTWAYLPVLCNLVGFQNIKEMPKDFGPVAIVLVATSKCGENMTLECRSLMGSVIKRGDNKSEMSVVPCFGVCNLQEAKLRLFHGCGVLVATPSSLLRLLRENSHQSLIHPARLKLLVIDDLDQMTAGTPDELRDVWRELFKIAPKRANGTLVPQLVLMSRLWDPTLMIGLLQRCNQPLLLIGDHLEAALYGQAAISLKFAQRNTKLAAIQHFIEEDPRHNQSLLIMCGHDSEVVHIVRELTQYGYSCIGYTSQSSADERAIMTMEWKKRLNPKKILVCSDEIFPELEQQNAQNLIHYSYSNFYTKFKLRFSALLASYENRVANGFAAIYPGNCAENRKPQRAKSLILLDVENSAQMTRLVDFWRRHNQKQSLPTDISTAYQSVLLQRDYCRAARGVVMCPDVMEFGNCDEPTCKYRHNLVASDKIPPNEDIPSVGDMRVLILKVFSASHYSARLLQHRAPGATQWRELRQSNRAGIFMMKLSLYYANAANRTLYWPPKVDDLCIYRTEEGYQRARIIDVPSLQGTNMAQIVELSLKLIDLGGVKSVKSDDLLVCADQFRDFPPLAVEMRLSGVRPFDNDRTWDKESLRSVTKWIMTDIAKNHCVHVSIHFALANTVWVRNVVVMKWLPTLGRYIYGVDVKNSLLKELMAECSDNNGIYDIALKKGLIDDGTSDCQGDQAVTADCNSACSQQLSLDTVFEDTNKMKKKRDDVLGDLPEMRTTEPVELSAVATPHNISRAILIETWCTLPEHELQLVQINADGGWSEIYLTATSGRYEELVALLEKHVERQKTEAPKRKFLLLPMHSCILKYGNVYSRAKLFSVCDGIHRFLLCDHAIFVSVHELKLWNDCVYETSEEIIAYAPYNSIHCTLAGIDCRHFADGERKAFAKSYQYVYAVGENAPKNEVDSHDWHKLGMRSYKVLLYECDKRDDFIGATMLNKVLLERGTATRDSDTEHFLEHCLGVDFNGFDLIDPEQLLRYENGNGSGYDVLKIKLEKVFKCFARSCELEGDSDGVESAKQLLKDTDLNQTAKQTMTDNEEKPKQQPIVKTAQAGAECKKSKSHNEYSSSIETTSTRCGSDVMPTLITPYKSPPTIWNETACLINLKIYAPDIDDYYLRVSADTVHFRAEVNGERCELVLNLLGTVEPQYTTHEIRGLNVVVHMIKSVYMKWPRLLHTPTKFVWLTYDLNALETMAKPRLPQLDTKLFHPNQVAVFDSDEENFDDNASTERNLLTTFTPIENNDDEFDPVEELF